MKLALETKLSPEELAAIQQGALQGLPNVVQNEPLCITLRDHYQTLVGGALGNTGETWCYISALWVAAGSRRLGWGSQLLMEVEAEAKRRGCRHLYLDTFSDQAAGFYLKNGYQTFATLEDFPGDRQRVFLRKDL